MAKANGCNIPENLYYLVDKHIWARLDADSVVTVGVTDVAQHLAGKVIAVSPKKVGKALSKGQSAGTVESGKWVGPVPLPVGGELVAINEALKKNPGLLNQDPYGEGWIVKVKPANWGEECKSLVTGDEGVALYQQLLDEKGIHCA
ncbi:MAG TPA: glycine cleavage system protein GcvH [Ktedonobacteraceae bacterium]|nr:glycine cleavage system protein GcvH [Ktedonobacteraceae bacterium]